MSLGSLYSGEMSLDSRKLCFHEKKTNFIAAVGIGFVCLVIGLPLWWKTTEVYRVSLPYSDIDSLAEQTIEYSTDINVINYVETLTGKDLGSLSNFVVKGLEGNSSSDVLSWYRVSVREATQDERNSLKKITSAGELERTVTGTANKYSIIILPKDNTLSVTMTTMGVNRCVFVVHKEECWFTDYGARIKGKNDSSIVGSLTAFEKKLMENQDVKTTGGKLHQGTPELIAEMAKVGRKTVADPEIRKNLGLNRDSPFLCATRDIEKLSDSIVKTIKTTLIREATVLKGYNTARGQRNIKPDKESMRSVRSHPGYDVTITLVSPRPDVIDVQWDIEKAVEVYLRPFLQKIEDYAKINLKSQVLFFTKLQSKPRKDKGSFYFTVNDLPLMINPLESKLGSPASTQPDLNFLVYVPTKEQHPLYIKDGKGEYISSNSFLSPQWGGVFIYNIKPPSENDTLPIRPFLEMRSVMEVFISQIRLLLNLHSQVSENVQTLPTGISAISDWEVDSWLRSRCVENIATSSASLKSLAQLLGEISNIVINDEIGQQVQVSVDSMKKSYKLLQDGNLVHAFLHSRAAAVASENAFFDPSLLELLYFPEDQKFAIYIPLFLPISFPVLASLWQAFQWYKKQRKLKQE